MEIWDKVWIDEDEFCYPGLIRAIGTDGNTVSVYKYALGIWLSNIVNPNNLRTRKETIAYDISTHRSKLIHAISTTN